MSRRDTPAVTRAGAGGGSYRSAARDGCDNGPVTRPCDSRDSVRDASRDTRPRAYLGAPVPVYARTRNKIIHAFLRFPGAAVHTYAHARGRATQPGTPEPSQAPVIAGHPATDWVHLTCCRPDVFLCGIEAPTPAGVLTDVPEEAICPACRAADDSDMPCGAPGCNAGRPRP